MNTNSTHNGYYFYKLSYVYYFDKDTQRLSDDCIPYEPSVAMLNSLVGTPWSTSPYEVERFFSREPSFYGLYILNGIKMSEHSDWKWAEIDLKLNKWENQTYSAPLGHAFLVMCAKVTLYLWKLYPQYLMGSRSGANYRNNNDDIYFDYKKAPWAYEDIIKMLCKYLGVTYRPSGKLAERISNYSGTIYSPAATACDEALYSLAYALWYDCDGARDRWRVPGEYLRKYDKFDGDHHYEIGLFYEELKKSFETFAAIVQLNDRFARQY